MENVYIAAGFRTAIGNIAGSLKGKSAVELGTASTVGTLERSGVKAADIDYVILGNVLQAAQGQNPARQVAIKAGLPVETPALTINKVCGSGLNSVALAGALIRSGEAECILAGGMESMSNAPYYLKNKGAGKRLSLTTQDAVTQDGLWDVFNDYHMGITAENVAEAYGITREQQDQLAAESQKKATAAQSHGRFEAEIIPVEVSLRRGETTLFKEDEFVKPQTSQEKIAKLRSAFKSDGTVTAANSSGINDGAATLIIASESFIKQNRITPLARIVSSASVGVDPSMMGIGPVPTIRKVLEKADLTTEDVDLWEINEAFAAQAKAVGNELGLDSQKVNPNGGAIALGHPIGASGARIAVTLLHEMNQRKARYGVASLCIGGGMGEAVLFERDELCE